MTAKDIEILENRMGAVETNVGKQTESINGLSGAIVALSAHFEHIVTAAQVETEIEKQLDSKLNFHIANCRLERAKLDLKTVLKNTVYIGGISGVVIMTILQFLH